jgi:hypothetical protein
MKAGPLPLDPRVWAEGAIGREAAVRRQDLPVAMPLQQVAARGDRDRAILRDGKGRVVERSLRRASATARSASRAATGVEPQIKVEAERALAAALAGWFGVPVVFP